MERLVPKDVDEACALVREASSARRWLAVEGAGSKASLGKPQQADAILSGKALSGITLYQPSELVISAKAGTPLREVEAALAEHGQHLPFEPVTYKTFCGQGEPTIGGIVACNLSGPRRIMAGACRDSLIGVTFVNGQGELIRSGGRVMKNVTGLDLVKLMAGSWGTLGFFTEVTFKVLPKPYNALTISLHHLNQTKAVGAMSLALGSPFEVSGAAHNPSDGGRTLLRLEGFDFSLEARAQRLMNLLNPFGECTVLEGEESRRLWADIGEVVPVATPDDALIWRLSVPPSQAPALLSRLQGQIELRSLMDWGGGLIWLSVPQAPDAYESLIRGVVREARGHAMLVRAPEEVRRQVPVFEPPAPGVALLTERLKEALDPRGVFSGRPL